LFELAVAGDRRLIELISSHPDFVDVYLDFIFAWQQADAPNRACMLFDSKNKTLQACIYRGIGRVSGTDPSLALTLFRKLPKLANCGEVILSNILVCDVIRHDFIQLLREVLALFPPSPYNSPTKSAIAARSPDCRWPEDPDLDQKGSPQNLSPWTFPGEVGQCTRVTTGQNYVMQCSWRCYTCGLVQDLGVCLACALTCHRGHDMVYVGCCECYCDCIDQDVTQCLHCPLSERNRLSRRSQRPPVGPSRFGSSGKFSGSFSCSRLGWGLKAAPPEPEKVETQDPLSVATVYRLIDQFSSSTVDDSPAPLRDRLTQTMR
jgi:hypothetical protein